MSHKQSNMLTGSSKISDLARKKAESDALFLSIGEGAIVTDEQGKISRINQAALDILGYEAHELIGKWYPSAVVAEDENYQVIPNIDRPITNVFLTGKTISTRVNYRRKDGSRITVYLTVSPVILDGEPIGAIEVFRNITREVELEKAKDEFISLASHQLRTPASAVKQYAGLMVQGYVGPLTDEQLMIAQTIYDCNERQLTIVNDLLRVAQVDAGKVKISLAEVNITRVIKEIIDEQASKFAMRQQKVIYQPASSAIKVRVDPQLMRMVIENIIDNASKYTPDHKTIEVRVQVKKDAVTIAIKDEGVGIDKKDIEQVFQKFSRLPNPLSSSVGGTGLGLYWAKKIVDLHGGQIKVSSKPNEGTTFTIYIPRTLKRSES